MSNKLFVCYGMNHTSYTLRGLEQPKYGLVMGIFLYFELDSINEQSRN